MTHAYFDQQAGYGRSHFAVGIAVVDNDFDLAGMEKVGFAAAAAVAGMGYH